MVNIGAEQQHYKVDGKASLHGRSHRLPGYLSLAGNTLPAGEDDIDVSFIPAIAGPQFAQFPGGIKPDERHMQSSVCAGVLSFNWCCVYYLTGGAALRGSRRVLSRCKPAYRDCPAIFPMHRRGDCWILATLSARNYQPLVFRCSAWRDFPGCINFRRADGRYWRADVGR